MHGYLACDVFKWFLAPEKYAKSSEPGLYLSQAKTQTDAAIDANGYAKPSKKNIRKVYIELTGSRRTSSQEGRSPWKKVRHGRKTGFNAKIATREGQRNESITTEE
jgi:hypothetical protein